MGKYIVIDFDGTCVKHEMPYIGADIGAVPVLKELVEAGHKLILFTMRSDATNPQGSDPEIINEPGNYLTQAVEWLIKGGIELYGVQTNPTQKHWTSSPKAYGHLRIDDSSCGCPLIRPENEKPYVDWVEVRKLLILEGLL